MNSVPAEALLLCLLLGVGLGLLFTILEFLRITLSLGRIVTALLDILFWLVTAAGSFVLSLAVSKGILRFYQVGCELLGFLCVHWTLTYLIRRFLPRLIRFLQKLSGRLHKRSVSGRKKFLLKKTANQEDPEKKRGFFGKPTKKNEKKT